MAPARQIDQQSTGPRSVEGTAVSRACLAQPTLYPAPVEEPLPAKPAPREPAPATARDWLRSGASVPIGATAWANASTAFERVAAIL